MFFSIAIKVKKKVYYYFRRLLTRSHYSVEQLRNKFGVIILSKFMKKHPEICNNTDLSQHLEQNEDDIRLKNNNNRQSGFKTDAEKLIKIRVFFGTSNAWNSLYSICTELDKDDKVDFRLIFDSRYATVETIEKLNFDFVNISEYSVEQDCPDAIVISHPYIETIIPNVRLYTKIIVVVSMALVCYCTTTEAFSDLLKEHLEKWSPDYYCFDTLLFKRLKNVDWISKRIIEMGNPKFDGIYNVYISHKYPESWEKKINNKRVILWTTDHGIYPINDNRKKYYIADDLTFDIYYRTIFKYAKKNQDLAIIIRPHPTFIYELTHYNIINSNLLDFFRRLCYLSNNVIFDETDSYDAAYAVMDAVITDSRCGIQCSALPLLKPICLLYRNHSKEALEPDLAANLYEAHSKHELVHFLQMVKRGKDYMYSQRTKFAQENIKNFDGKNGYRIKQFIMNKINNRYGEII